MSTFEVRFTTTVEIVVDLEAANEDSAEEIAAVMAESLLQRASDGPARVLGSIDGQPGEVTEVSP